MIRFLKDKKINFVSQFKYAKYLSYSLIFLGVILYFSKGPTLGIDFKGGTEVIVKLDDNLSTKEQLATYLNSKSIKFSNIKTYGNDNIRILFENDMDQNLINKNINVVSFNKIGSTISSDLKYDALKALSIALLLIGLYIIIRFDWYSAIGSIFALFHDILIVMTLLILFSFEFIISSFTNESFKISRLAPNKAGIDKIKDILEASYLLKFRNLEPVITIPALLAPGIKANT